MTPLPLGLSVRLLPADARDEVLVELLERFDRIAAEQGRERPWRACGGAPDRARGGRQ